MTLDPRTPVLVGIGVTQQKEDDPSNAVSAIELMVQAVEMAAVDAGSENLLSQAQLISVPKGIWGYSDPAKLIADEIGADQAKSQLAEIGILQQTLMGQACQRIADGELDIAIVAGGEAKYRDLRATITGVSVADHVQEGAVPDERLEPESEIWSEIESAAGLGMPVGYYALMDSARRAAKGFSIDQQRDEIAAIYEGFSRVAVENPHAWNREQVTAEAIRNAGPKNKMLAFPYTKLHNSQWNVDQAAGLIFCSLAKAQELGLDESQWVYPLASTESNHMVNVSQREQLYRSKGAEIAGQRALDIAAIDVNAVEFLEMYSCFPIAVTSYADELGVNLSRSLTVTGGMTFGGGPLNNFVLQATCRMAELLRKKPESKGLVTSVSGMLTKQGFGVWSASAGTQPYSYEDVTDTVKAQAKVVDLVPAIDGSACIIAATVLAQPPRAVVVCELENGSRSVAYSEDQMLMDKITEEELIGVEITLKEGRFSLS